METTDIFDFNGNRVTVIRPEKPNGRWIWKTEFLYAFDYAERALLEKGYTRVYYQISDKYGSAHAVRLMRRFYHFIVQKYNLEKKCILFGFSRGGLYAFNFALFYPQYVEKLYLDAPVLDLKTWPVEGSVEQQQLFEEYGLNRDTLKTFKGNPIDCLAEFFALNIPTLLIAGEIDDVVPFKENAQKMIDFASRNGRPLTVFVKPTCGHHPHSLKDNIELIVRFCEET